LPAQHRRAEVTAEQPAEVVQVLLPQRTVQPERGAAGVHQLDRRGQAERRAHRVARDELDHQERHRHQHPQRHDEPPEAAGGEGQPGADLRARDNDRAGHQEYIRMEDGFR
jgi:hypothetical protein